MDEVHDLVFDDSLVSSFFFPGFAVEWLGIEDITIQEILNMEGLSKCMRLIFFVVLGGMAEGIFASWVSNSVCQ